MDLRLCEPRANYVSSIFRALLWNFNDLKNHSKDLYGLQDYETVISEKRMNSTGLQEQDPIS
jgi:hypothetical protein